MCVECVYLCVIVSICVVFCVNMCVFCVNMCHFVPYCVVLCVFLCVLCVFVRISASRIVGCVFPPPKLMYRTASRMSYLLRCQFWGVQSWGVCTCVYLGVCQYGGFLCPYVSIVCIPVCIVCICTYSGVKSCEYVCFVSFFVNSME